MENKLFCFVVIALVVATQLEEAQCGEANDFCHANLTALGGTPDAIEVPSGSSAVYSTDLQVIALCPPDNILLKCNESTSFTFSDGEQTLVNISCASDYKLKRQKIDGGTEELKSMPPCLGPCQGGTTCMFMFLNTTRTFDTGKETTAENLKDVYNPEMLGCEGDMVALSCPNSEHTIHFDYQAETWNPNVDTGLSKFTATCTNGVFTSPSKTVPSILNSTVYQPKCKVPIPTCKDGAPCTFKFLNSSANFLTDSSTTAVNVANEYNPVMMGCDGAIVALKCEAADMMIHLSFQNPNGTYHAELDTGVNLLESTCTAGNFSTTSTVVPDLWGMLEYHAKCMVPVTTTTTASTTTTTESSTTSTAASTTTASKTTSTSTTIASTTSTTIASTSTTGSSGTTSSSSSSTGTDSSTAGSTTAQESTTTTASGADGDTTSTTTSADSNAGSTSGGSDGNTTTSAADGNSTTSAGTENPDGGTTLSYSAVKGGRSIISNNAYITHANVLPQAFWHLIFSMRFS